MGKDEGGAGDVADLAGAGGDVLEGVPPAGDQREPEAQLAALAAATPRAADPTLLEELPLAGDILPGLPDDLKVRLFEAFDLQILWNKPGQQATVFAEITEATLQALPGILDPARDGYDDTNESARKEPDAAEDLYDTPIAHRIFREARIIRVKPS